MLKATLILTLFCINIQAAYDPLSLDDKCNKATLVIKAKVVSITKIAKNTPTNKFNAEAQSLALVEVSEYLKSQDIGHKIKKSVKNKRSFDYHNTGLPKYILVPCGYLFAESPSDLTTGREYIMFLYKIGDGIYHPLDPSSTHVIQEGKVGIFGVNDFPTNKKSSQKLNEFIAYIKRKFK